MFTLEEQCPKRFTVRASQFFLKMCPPALYCCVRLCLAILYICLPTLAVAGSSFDFEKHKLFGVGGVILFFVVVYSPSSLLLGVLNSFLRCVRPMCHCWRPPFSAGHVACLFICLPVCHCWCPPFSAGHASVLVICLPGLSLLVSALFRWPCSISIHLSPRSVAAGVSPFPLAM